MNILLKKIIIINILIMLALNGYAQTEIIIEDENFSTGNVVIPDNFQKFNKWDNTSSSDYFLEKVSEGLRVYSYVPQASIASMENTLGLIDGREYEISVNVTNLEGSRIRVRAYIPNHPDGEKHFGNKVKKGKTGVTTLTITWHSGAGAYFSVVGESSISKTEFIVHSIIIKDLSVSNSVIENENFSDGNVVIPNNLQKFNKWDNTSSSDYFLEKVSEGLRVYSYVPQASIGSMENNLGLINGHVYEISVNATNVDGSRIRARAYIPSHPNESRHYGNRIKAGETGISMLTVTWYSGEGAYFAVVGESATSKTEFIVHSIVIKDLYGSKVNDVAEIQALRDLYQDTDGDNWTNNTGWPKTASEWDAITSVNQIVNWYGIEALEGDIVRILLPDNKLTGSVPQNLTNLKVLKQLNISDNQLIGAVDIQFNLLVELSSLSLHNNQINSLPNDFKAHPNKTNLQIKIENNQIPLRDIEKNLTGIDEHEFSLYLYSPQSSPNNTILTEYYSNQSITFNNDRAGGAYTSYQWMKNSGNGWINISAATSENYTLTAIAADDGTRYRCQMRNTWVKNVFSYSHIFELKKLIPPVNDLTHTPQYNGNISAVKWMRHGEQEEKLYTYHYDAMNRIKAAHYAQGNTNNGTWATTSSQGGFNVHGIDYDFNGNITALNRQAIETDIKTIDALSYHYNNKGNQLTKVEDGGLDSGFKDGNEAGDDYEYDINGNMIKDLNKGIAVIEYNHLNLPEKVIKDDGQYIKFTYDASGVKRSQEVYDATNELIKKADYIGEFIYEQDQSSEPLELKIILHEEGRLVQDKISNNWDYEYFLKDHLDNTRIIFTTKTADSELVIVQKEDYYPFGLEFNYSQKSANDTNQFKFNGKEYIVELEWYDYQARMYSPDLGRFTSHDPLTEKYFSQSQYLYAYNNPVRFTDFMGLSGEDEIKKDPQPVKKADGLDIQVYENRDVFTETVTTHNTIQRTVLLGDEDNPNPEFIKILGGSVVRNPKKEIGNEITVTDHITTVTEVKVAILYDSEGNEEARKTKTTRSKTTHSSAEIKDQFGGVYATADLGVKTSKPRVKNSVGKISNNLQSWISDASKYRTNSLSSPSSSSSSSLLGRYIDFVIFKMTKEKPINRLKIATPVHR